MKFINKLIFSLSVMITVLLVVPCCIVWFANVPSGMGAMLILMLFVNPAVSGFLGVWVCRATRQLWWIPLLFGILFMVCYWIALGSVIWDLYVYAIAYWVIGTAAMRVAKRIADLIDARKREKWE